MGSGSSEETMAGDPVRIGPWNIVRKIGAGGMGNVYLGRRDDGDDGTEQAAVKVLPASLAREEGFVLRFGREVEAMEKLQNPHIVQLIEHGVDGETYYYAMEYVEGDTLTAKIRREKRIPWQEAVQIAIQVCVALKAAHDAGIVHRDLKPSNLMVTEEGEIKLTDFGVAQVFAAGKLTATGGIIGTAEYMSPEQAQGRRATKKSDLYSLGALLYVMVTGRPPFTGTTTIDVIQKHKFGRFDRPQLIVPEIPNQLDDLICQLLEKDPEKRLPDAYVVSLRLKEVLKRHEFQQKTSVSGGGLSQMDSLAQTRVANITEEPQGGDPSPTLMRDLLRAELEGSGEQSTFGRLMNNTWVLVGLLALIVAISVLWFRSLKLSPDEQFARGEELMQQDAGAAWIEARDEFFLPLVEADPEAWTEKVDPYLEQVRLHELEQELNPRNLKRKISGEIPDEPSRLYALARNYEEMGDFGKAMRMLTSLEVALRDDKERADLHQLVRHRLGELYHRDEDAEEPETSFVDDLLAKARAAYAAGEIETAVELARSVIVLYEADPTAETTVTEARELLRDWTDKGTEDSAE